MKRRGIIKMATLVIITVLCVVLMVVAAWFAIRTSDLVSAVIGSSVVSLMASVLFLILHAPDVAMTEAAIGAGLSTFVFLIAIRKTERYEKDEEQ